MSEPLLLSLIVIAFVLPAIPGYTLAKRCRLRGSGLAFIPWVGLWIIVFRSIGWTGWLLGLLLAVVIALPFLGLAVIAWAGIRAPAVHHRSQWWTAALVVPIVNLVGYWIYAYTLPRPEAMTFSEQASH